MTVVRVIVGVSVRSVFVAVLRGMAVCMSFVPVLVIMMIVVVLVTVRMPVSVFVFRHFLTS